MVERDQFPMEEAVGVKRDALLLGATVRCPARQERLACVALIEGAFWGARCWQHCFEPGTLTTLNVRGAAPALLLSSCEPRGTGEGSEGGFTPHPPDHSIAPLTCNKRGFLSYTHMYMFLNMCSSI